MHTSGEPHSVNRGLAEIRTRAGAIVAVLIASACTSGSTMTNAGKPLNDPAEAFVSGELPKDAQDALCAMMGFAEITLVLAAPRIMAKAGRIPSRMELLKVLEDYMAVIADAKKKPQSEDSLPHIAAEPHAIRLRELIATWEPSLDVPDEIRQEARATLRATNTKEPAEGWDNYEGESE
jgi:hypothetical protein